MAMLPQAKDIPSRALLRKLARDNAEMGPRLAQLEFREMQNELASPSLFDLNIDFPAGPTVAQLVLPPVATLPEARGLPALNVPLGKIAWISDEVELPVIGIYCRAAGGDGLRNALLGIMKSHHAQPFARLVFICAQFRPIPFFGRYNFAYEYIGLQPVEEAAPRLVLRYGITEIRDVEDGKVLFKKASDEVEIE